MPGRTVPAPDPRVVGPRRKQALHQALQVGALDFELMAARAGLAVAVGGVFIAAYATIFVSRDLGLLTAAVAVLSGWWFWGVHTALKRDFATDTLRWLSPIYEVGMPGILLLAINFAEGPRYALGTWVAPQLFAVFILLSILRLNVWLPTVLGIVAALEYGLIWWFFINPDLGVTDDLLYLPRVQYIRCTSLVVTGFAGSLAVRGLIRLIERANRDVRSRDLFGKYRLGKTIASGGMGTVVHATYAPEGGFEREVAVKLIHPHLADDPMFLRRFRNEARLSARLAHPNIVPALDFGIVDGQYFFAMDYVDGPTLTEVQKYTFETGFPLQLALIAYIGQQVCEALDHAHTRAVDGQGRVLQVVHRDVSPGNVMFHHSGAVRVLDFGVARALGDNQVETTQNLVGKPSYVAPEQLRHDSVDARSDLWSLGVLLWELVCNRSLFRRDGEASTMMAVVDYEIPTVFDHRKGIGEHWQQFFERALQRDPGERFQSAVQMRDELNRIIELEGGAGMNEVAMMVAAVIEEHDELDLDFETGEIG